MDHVRGSSLVWPATLETLRPFILTWWSGRTVEDMPKDIRAVYDAAKFGTQHINLALVVLDAKGEYLRSTVPYVRPPSFKFDPELQGKSFKDQLDALVKGLELPKVEKPAKPKLTLPEICEEGAFVGVRIYLTAEANRMNHYRTPIVEAVAMTDGVKRALTYAGSECTMDAGDLKPWLEQLYPAAIMDGLGGFRSISGPLKYKPAGPDAKHRYAVIEGAVDFELDNTSRTRYRGDLALAVKYELTGRAAVGVRGVCTFTAPKGPETIKLAAAIESLPE